jgi:hypothetical protein
MAESDFHRSALNAEVSSSQDPRNSPTASPTGVDVLAECTTVIDSIARKADKNKTRARWSSGALTATTAAIPVCLIVAERFAAESLGAFIAGRLAPGLLAAFAAVLGRWIQIEQPHQRWTLYRRWHRLFEAERLRYRQRIGRYADGNADDKLMEVLAQGQLDLDDEWASLVPRSRELTADTAQGAK